MPLAASVALHVAAIVGWQGERGPAMPGGRPAMVRLEVALREPPSQAPLRDAAAPPVALAAPPAKRPVKPADKASPSTLANASAGARAKTVLEPMAEPEVSARSPGQARAGLEPRASESASTSGIESGSAGIGTATPAPRRPLDLSLGPGRRDATPSSAATQAAASGVYGRPGADAASPEAQAVRRAMREDCRRAHAAGGLVAIGPLVADAVKGEGCRW